MLIHLENVDKEYLMGGEPVRALNGVSLEIAAGELTAIIGPSGSGKSTLMNILGLLDRPTRGRYLLDGTDVTLLDDDRLAHERNQRIGFVFQTFNLLPRQTALENVALPLIYAGTRRAERMTLAKAALERVELTERMHHKPNELSGGQRQRVAIARALVNNPSLLLADEPTGNLDSRTGGEILDLFARLNQEHKVTVLLVTHDPAVAKRARRTVEVFDGKVRA